MATFSFLIRTAAKSLERLIEARTKGALTARQVDVLLLLDATPGLSAAEIGRRLSVDKATMANLMQRLLEKKFVKQVADESDGRASKNYLTREGKSKLGPARDIEADLDAQIQNAMASERPLADKLRALSAIKNADG